MTLSIALSLILRPRHVKGGKLLNFSVSFSSLPSLFSLSTVKVFIARSKSVAADERASERAVHCLLRVCLHQGEPYK